MDNRFITMETLFMVRKCVYMFLRFTIVVEIVYLYTCTEYVHLLFKSLDEGYAGDEKNIH